MQIQKNGIDYLVIREPVYRSDLGVKRIELYGEAARAFLDYFTSEWVTEEGLFGGWETVLTVDIFYRHRYAVTIRVAPRFERYVTSEMRNGGELAIAEGFRNVLEKLARDAAENEGK